MACCPPTRTIHALTTLAILAAAWFTPLSGAQAGVAVTDSLAFAPDTARSSEETTLEVFEDEGVLPRAPFGEKLITDADTWRADGDPDSRSHFLIDYNRVDRLRLGLGWELQSPETMYPRLGARLEYAINRKRALYGVAFEQPLVDPERFAIGVSMIRRTDHNELYQVGDAENSLALLFARQDYRDYYEREGFGAYLAARFPGITTFSVHVRSDEYRSIGVDRGTRSFFNTHRELRDNPAIDPGEARTLSWRLEYRAHPRERLRAGFYHWIDVERARRDFSYTRLLADLRGVIRLSPATTLAVRAVAGHLFDGTLPAHKTFVVGGVDGLRAHTFSKYRGDQMLLGQAEYTIGLWRLRSEFFQGGLHAIAFVDAGRAWSNPRHAWDVGRQRIEADGGFGLGTSEDNLRVYFAKNLRDPGSDFVVSVRLQRPF